MTKSVKPNNLYKSKDLRQILGIVFNSQNICKSLQKSDINLENVEEIIVEVTKSREAADFVVEKFINIQINSSKFRNRKQKNMKT